MFCLSYWSITVSVSLLDMSDYMSLFRGLTSAHGSFLPSGEIEENGKKKGKSFTETEIVTEDAYKAHLEGKKGLGIVPINEEEECYFSAIDVDKYADNSSLIDTIYKHGFPIVPFRSKSGGLHLYVFFREPTKAKLVVVAMRSLRIMLGLSDKTEIFPKQAMRISADSIGNWINLPYFDASKTDRYAYSKKGTALSLQEALNYCKDKATSVEDIEKFQKDAPLSDAPPCLQSIYMAGDTASRNLYLFSLARYFKAKFGDEYEQYVMESNSRLKKPLPSSEITNIIQSHKKKEYGYRCSEEPLCSLCNRGICVTRELGIRSASISDLNFEDLVQWATDPPFYEWKVNDHILRFYDEDDIIRQQAFRKLCFRELHILPIRLKDETWARVVNTALKNMEVKRVSAEDDVSPGAMFRELLTEFMTKRAMADTKEQLLIDKVYLDEAIDSYVFKAKNLLNFLFLKQFRYFGQTEIQSRIRQLGGMATRYYVNEKNRSMRVWTIPRKSLHSFIDTALDEVACDFTEQYKNEVF